MATVAVLFLVAGHLAFCADGQTQDLSRQLGDALRRRNVGAAQEGARSLEDVEGSIWPTFQSLPKNQHGRLDRAQVGYAAQRYLARERGWRIEGFGGGFSGLGGHQMSSKGWMTEALFEAVGAYRGGRGLSVGDLALVVSVIENAMLQEPLASRSASRVKLQHETCKARKEALQGLGQPNTGRMPLRTFYTGGEVSDLESPSFLRAAGVVEENDEPQLLIANYMLLPSNCVGSSGSSISVCCVSSCETIVQQLEETLQGPVVSPERMLHVVAGMSSSPMAPALAKQLLVIAANNEGVVPLHSTAFAEWIHYVFPTDCPRPIEAQTTDEVEDATEAVQKLRKDAAAPYTAARMIADYAATSAPEQPESVKADGPAMSAAPPAAEAEEMQTPKVEMPTHSLSFQTVGRIAVLCLMAFAMLRTVVSQWRGAGGVLRGEDAMKDAKKWG